MPTGFDTHNHATCIEHALDVAVRYCADHKLNLTKPRKRVLEILLSEHKAMGAYDILAILNDEGMGSQPPLVYRALEFLVQHDFAHKLEKQNAYIACSYPAQDHLPIFMICKKCDAVQEAQTTGDATLLVTAAQDCGFAIETTVVEAEGLCRSCQSAGANPCD